MRMTPILQILHAPHYNSKHWQRRLQNNHQVNVLRCIYANISAHLLSIYVVFRHQSGEQI